MMCDYCKLQIPINKMEGRNSCQYCGETMTLCVNDILKLGTGGVAKEVRPSQLEMALDIERIFRKGSGTLLAEGGTGIGKTFAYCIPVLTNQTGRTIISTDKKNLQKQLAGTDIPYLRNRLDLPDKSYCEYKGKNNYACFLLKDAVPLIDRTQYENFINIDNRKCPAEYSFYPGGKPDWWYKISLDNCPIPDGCKYSKWCRVHPKDYDLVVINHTLLALDLMLTPGFLLGPYETLIIDEAHGAPAAFREAYKMKLGRGATNSLMSALANNAKLRAAMNSHGPISAKNMKDFLVNLDNDFDALYQKAINNANNRGVLDLGEIQSEVTKFGTLALKLSSGVGIQLAALEVEYKALKSLGEEDDASRVLPLIGSTKRMKKKLSKMAKFALELQTDSTSEPSGKDYMATGDSQGLYLEPVKIGDEVCTPLAQIPKKIVVSATLSSEGDFTLIKEELGLEGTSTINKKYVSPFNLKEQASLYMPLGMPEHAARNDPAKRETWLKETCREICQLIDLTRGNAFVLCVSREDMEDITEYIEAKDFWKDTGLPVVIQGDSVDHTFATYMRTPNCTLFGLKSFWEGVDVPGPKLMQVIITRLPFPYFGNAILQELIRRDEVEKPGSSFDKRIYSKMAMDTKQGAGRLIRTLTDHGIVTILDRRFWLGKLKGTKGEIAMKKLIEMDPKERRPLGYGRKLFIELGFKRASAEFKTLRGHVKTWFGI